MAREQAEHTTCRHPCCLTSHSCSLTGVGPGPHHLPLSQKMSHTVQWQQKTRTAPFGGLGVATLFRCDLWCAVTPMCHAICIWPQSYTKSPWTHLFASTGIEESVFLPPLSLPANTGIWICSSVAVYFACQRRLAWSVSLPHLPWMSGFQSLLGRNRISEHSCAMCSHLTTSFSNIKALLAWDPQKMFVSCCWDEVIGPSGDACSQGDSAGTAWWLPFSPLPPYLLLVFYPNSPFFSSLFPILASHPEAVSTSELFQESAHQKKWNS